MEMPTPCAECHELCEFENMQSIGNELYCDDCFEVMKEGEVLSHEKQ